MSTNLKDSYPRSAVVRDLSRELADLLAKELERQTRTCVNCLHWRNDNETCGLTDGLRPPAKVIVAGCDKHEDEIPF